MKEFTWWLICCVFVASLLVQTGLGKSVQGKAKSGKVRSASAKAKHKEKALYGKIYEETKHDVNRAIEDAILEASKKATDMVLQPKVTSKLVDNMASKIQAEVAGSGEGEGGNAIDEMAQSYTAAVTDKLNGKAPTNTEHKKSDHKKGSKKHNAAKPKKSGKGKSVKASQEKAKAVEQTVKLDEETPKSADENAKAEEDAAKPEDTVESVTVSGVDDEEAEAAAATDKTPSDEPPTEVKVKIDEGEEKEEKEEKPEENEEKPASKAAPKKEGADVMSDNGLDASGMDMDMDDIDNKSAAKDEDTPEGEADEEMEEKSDLVPTDISEKEPEARNSGPVDQQSSAPPAAPAAPPATKPGAAELAALGAKQLAQDGGQEDLKALLDESINNLVRANSAVEVLLKATNPNSIAAVQQQAMQQVQPQAQQQVAAMQAPMLQQRQV